MKYDDKFNDKKMKKSMKKIMCMLLLIYSGLIMAQMKQIVTANGEKITIHPHPVLGANNGVTDTIVTMLGTKYRMLRLGGKLIQPTKIETTQANILEIKGASTGAIKITDGNQLAGRVLISDANGVGTWQANTGGQSSLYKIYKASATLYPPQSVSTPMPGIGPFTAAATGRYQIIFHSFFTNIGASGVKQYYFGAYRSGTELYNDETYGYVAAGQYLNNHLSRVVYLNANDVVDFRTFIMSGDLAMTVLYDRNIVEVIYLGT